MPTVSAASRVADRRAVRVLQGEAGGAGGRGGVHDLDPRQVGLEPPLALVRGLAEGVDPLDALEVRHGRDEVHVDRHVKLRADPHVGLRKHVERLRHDAVRRVLDGHHAVVGPPVLHRAERLRDGVDGDPLGARPEGQERGLVGVGARRPPVGDADGLLGGDGGGDDLAVDRVELPGGERAGVVALQLLEDRPLALGHEERRPLPALGDAHLDRQFRAAAQQPHQVAVHRVDVLPDGVERSRFGVGHGPYCDRGPPEIFRAVSVLSDRAEVPGSISIVDENPSSPGSLLVSEANMSETVTE